jgi:RNA polymerase sigma-70 factor (ECF subfamily)
VAERHRGDIEDVEAVRHVLAGDIDAFSGIVERWQGRLINLAWRFCRDRSMAEDMAQDALVKAFKALDTLRGKAQFSTWLIALSLNCYRSSLRSREPVTVNLGLFRPASPDSSALTALQNRERDEMVRQLVTTLPPRYRDPIVLFYFQEMSVAETRACWACRRAHSRLAFLEGGISSAVATRPAWPPGKARSKPWTISTASCHPKIPSRHRPALSQRLWTLCARCRNGLRRCRSPGSVFCLVWPLLASGRLRGGH